MIIVGRVKFELHHQFEVAQGGAVYDVDNLVVMTPKDMFCFTVVKNNDEYKN
jgi:hypothetical protein